MEFKKSLNRADIVWSYVAKGFSFGTGIIVLPLILRLLSENEIALNYVFLSLSQLVLLFDFGFSPQFSRNFAYVFGGAQEVVSIGVPSQSSNGINYNLLYRLYKTAQLFYGYMSIALCLVLFFGGAIYIYHFTEGFSLIENSLLLWLGFSVSIVIDFFYKYYSPLLLGAGKIKTVAQIEVFSQIVRLIFLSVLLLLGLGLWSIVVSNFCRVLILRWMSYKSFFSVTIKKEFIYCKNNVAVKAKELLKTLWYNARKAIVVSLTTYTCSQWGLFLSGLFLTKSEVASYGLLLQIVGLLSTVSLTVGQSYIPIYSALRVAGNWVKIKDNFYFSMGVYYLLFILGGITLLFWGASILSFIKSNAVLPVIIVTAIVIVYKFLEGQHVLCSSYLTTQNVIVDFESSLILGVVNFVLLWIVLKCTSWGLLGIVATQLLTGLAYPNWKWPFEVCREFSVSYPKLVGASFYTVFAKLKNVIMHV